MISWHHAFCHCGDHTSSIHFNSKHLVSKVVETTWTLATTKIVHVDTWLVHICKTKDAKVWIAITISLMKIPQWLPIQMIYYIIIRVHGSKCISNLQFTKYYIQIYFMENSFIFMTLIDNWSSWQPILMKVLNSFRFVIDNTIGLRNK